MKRKAVQELEAVTSAQRRQAPTFIKMLLKTLGNINDLENEKNPDGEMTPEVWFGIKTDALFEMIKSEEIAAMEAAAKGKKAKAKQHAFRASRPESDPSP